ncbi:MAG: hypothetical protein ACM3WS_07810 [Bacillota bacterium]
MTIGKFTRMLVLLSAAAAGFAFAAGDLPTKFSNQGSIANTRHNLTQRQNAGGPTGAMMDNYRNDYGEVCVYCHTPHGANTTITLPLWNRTIKATMYTTYNQLGTSTLTQTVAQPGNNSLACLSCHDGQSAVDSIINMPGSVRYLKSQETTQNDSFLNAWSNLARHGHGLAVIRNDPGGRDAPRRPLLRGGDCSKTGPEGPCFFCFFMATSSLPCFRKHPRAGFQQQELPLCMHCGRIPQLPGNGRGVLSGPRASNRKRKAIRRPKACAVSGRIKNNNACCCKSGTGPARTCIEGWRLHEQLNRAFRGLLLGTGPGWPLHAY